MLPAANAPTASAGRNGRIPAAAAIPMPWKMSNARCMCATVNGRDDTCSGRSCAGPEGEGDMSSGSDSREGRRRSTRHDLERYAGLFAERTKVMKSSAMRDLMALTEQPDVISLAGGLPDTSTFPPDSYASLMKTVAAESCSRALQYGPTEGLTLVKGCISDVMLDEGVEDDLHEAEGTARGREVKELACNTRRDPGSIVVCEAR